MARYDFKLTTNKGAIFTRSSDRLYTHAVVFSYKDGKERKPEYCSRLDLAQKKTMPSWYPQDMKKDIYLVEIVKDRQAGK